MKQHLLFTTKVTILLLLLLLLVYLDLTAGTLSIGGKDLILFLFDRSLLDEQKILILSNFRVPRVITALLAGGALSVSGLQMQTLFRNMLAGPYVLGISSGASLGAALVLLGTGAVGTGLLMKWGIVFASWSGAALVMGMLLLVSLRIKNIMTILILGIMVSSGLSAIISILQYFGNAVALKSFVIWSMGSLGDVSGSSLQILLIVVVLGWLIALLSVKGLNGLMLGEEIASTLGVPVRKTRTLVFISTSLLAGTVTAFCGPIGFIGIAVPHITRYLFRISDLRYLLPATLLVGMVIMVFSDLVSQMPGSDMILPVNAITSLIGIPVVIWVIFGRYKKMERSSA